jgi:hypothetical protein
MGERQEYRLLPNSYPKYEKEEQIRLSNDALKVIDQMRAFMRDRRLSDTELIQKLQMINASQLNPLVNRIEQLEQRMHQLEAKSADHEYRISDVEIELRVQQRRIQAGEVYVDELYRQIMRVDSMAQVERKQMQQQLARVNQRLDGHDQKLVENDKKFNQIERDNKGRDERIENILKTHFHFYYNGLYFKPEFWQNHFQNQPIADYQEILFDGAGSGLSLLIQRRIRIYGDLYYMLAKPKMPRQKVDISGKPLENEISISGIGANALANVVFFPKRWLSLELGGGYGWTFYTISDQLNNRTLNEYQFRTRGMLGAVTITLTGKKMAVFGQGIGVLKGRELMYGLAKGGISIIF